MDLAIRLIRQTTDEILRKKSREVAESDILLEKNLRRHGGNYAQI